MNALSQTKIYNTMGKIFGDLGKTLGSLNFQPYLIPENLYMSLYVDYFKTYNYPLARNVFEACKASIIRPCLLADPYDREVVKSSNITDKIPQNIFTFGAINNNKLICYVDTSMKGKYDRNKITDDVDKYRIDPSNFYAYMQAGYLFHFCKVNNAKLSNAKVLLKELCTCFVVLLSKIIDSKLSISANRGDFHILMYLCACYFYESFCGYTKEKAIESAKQLKFILKDHIPSKCAYHNNDISMKYDEKLIEKDIFPINIFINLVSEQFNLGNKINYRDLATWWSNLYGSQSIAAIEDSTTFIIMLTLIQLRSNFYNDTIVARSLKKELPEIPKLFLQLI